MLKNPTPILHSDSVTLGNEYKEVMFKRRVSTVNLIMITHKEEFSHSLMEDLFFVIGRILKHIDGKLLYIYFKSALFKAKRIAPPLHPSKFTINKMNM